MHQSHIRDAKSKGKDFEKLLKNESVIKNFKADLEFIKNNDLLPSISGGLSLLNLNQFMARSQTIIDGCKTYSILSKSGQLI